MKQTKILLIDAAEISSATFSNETVTALENAADVIRQGGLVVFPTETVYGLGADGTSADAARKIYAAKNRPSDNPLIIHIEKPEDAELYAKTCELYYKFARAFMPGPLTVILPKKDTVPFSVTGGLDSVALRCPSHPVARRLIGLAGVPIAAPSANLSGKPSPTCAEHVIEDMMGRVDMIIDGGESDIGLESTIIKIDGKTVTLLRPGGITYDALSCVTDGVEIASAVTEQLAKDERPLSPGMKYRHYAPDAPVVLLDGKEEDVIEFLKAESQRSDCLILCYTEETGLLPSERIIDIGRMNDAQAQAHKLFSALRDADKLSPSIIYAHLPQKDGIGLALYNRMIRAAAHTVKYIPSGMKGNNLI
ncbi:MAG: threonylcarbamoyl-AMP synthase [Clostridia bacterium]|nr:threonylcarbamoyl-AMP synthase [Clostridia bacterium]